MLTRVRCYRPRYGLIISPTPKIADAIEKSRHEYIYTITMTKKTYELKFYLCETQSPILNVAFF